MATTDKTTRFAHETVENISHAGHQAAEAITEKGEQLKNAEKELVENCRGFLRDNPVTSIGIAVAAGFLLSRLLSSR